jgi:hypothetical protein
MHAPKSLQVPGVVFHSGFSNVLYMFTLNLVDFEDSVNLSVREIFHICTHLECKMNLEGIGVHIFNSSYPAWPLRYISLSIIVDNYF